MLDPFRQPVVRSGGAVHRPATPPRRTPLPGAESLVAAVNPSPTKDVFSNGVTNGQSNTHSTESQEIRYPWHLWCGRSVWIHRRVVKGGRALYRCSLEQNHEARLFEVPQWMFDSGACCQVHIAEKPAVNCAALLDLKLLLHHARSCLRSAPLGNHRPSAIPWLQNAPAVRRLVAEECSRSVELLPATNGARTRFLHPPTARFLGASQSRRSELVRAF